MMQTVSIGGQSYALEQNDTVYTVQMSWEPDVTNENFLRELEQKWQGQEDALFEKVDPHRAFLTLIGLEQYELSPGFWLRRALYTDGSPHLLERRARA